MNRRTRIRLALASTLPTLLALPVLCLLAALGVVPWPVLFAVPVALALHAAVSFFRWDHELPKAGSGRPGSV
ncbi:hypothetical protein ME763_28780 [Streptomyces murinus]|uniref:hypothetical protein n=1 Tax=Streptomyces TaxID=1883 RepID=UPI000A1F415D|nr:hypothetical protein [Streptomyces murinus]WDO09332.1 hypothetical protein ME763_28780 [Streptomyces murinus]